MVVFFLFCDSGPSIARSCVASLIGESQNEKRRFGEIDIWPSCRLPIPDTGSRLKH